MPRISSTSSISGTGFMKWMPMKRSGRSVEEASRVIEIDEVLVPRMASGLSDAAELGEDLALDVFLLGRGLDDEVAVGEGLACCRPAAMRLSAACALVLGDRASCATCRAMLPLMVAMPALMRSGETSLSITSKPASAQTWAMPLPIWPAPTTPTFLIRERHFPLIRRPERLAPLPRP